MAASAGTVVLTAVTTMPMLPATLAAPIPAAFPPRAEGFNEGDVPLHRWTVEEYDRAVALGALTPEMRVELLDGLITEKIPNDPPHASPVSLLTQFFAERGAGRWVVRCQLPVRLPEQRSEPEPDVALFHPPRARYARRHPEPADVFLLIEVADSSLLTDRKRKGPLYARAGVPEYWIVNVPGRAVEVHRDPDAAAGVYRVTESFRPGATVAPAAFPDAALPVAGLFEGGGAESGAGLPDR